MTLAVKCRCGKKYKLKPELAGKKFRCRDCGAPIKIPARGAQTEESPAARSDVAAARAKDEVADEFADEFDAFAENSDAGSEGDYDYDYDDDSWLDDANDVSDDAYQQEISQFRGRVAKSPKSPPKSAQKATHPPESESRVVNRVFIALAVLGVIVGVAVIGKMEHSRRLRLAREEFVSLQKAAEAKVAAEEFNSALTGYQTLIEHWGADADKAVVQTMHDALARMLTAETVAADIDGLNDQQLLNLMRLGEFEPAQQLPAPLQSGAKRFWIRALQQAGAAEVAKRHTEKARLLSLVSTEFLNELEELHSLQAKSLEITSRNEVEEKIARRWMDDFFERLPDKMELAMNLANWRDHCSLEDARTAATRTFLADDDRFDFDLDFPDAAEITIERTFLGATVNMKEVPREVSLTTRYTADIELRATVTARVVLNDGSVESAEAQYNEQVSYSWQSDHWVLKIPGSFAAFQDVLPKEIL